MSEKAARTAIPHAHGHDFSVADMKAAIVHAPDNQLAIITSS
jgi:hypothetical protein